MLKQLSLAAALALSALTPAQAVVVTQWNFNSVTPDNDITSGTKTPSIGTGTAAAIGGVTGGFASGAVNGGSSDPATSDDSGWQTTGYRAQGTGDKTAGASFMVSTVGFRDVVISYDLRHSNTAARHEAVQYTLDGTSWLDATTFVGGAGDTWFNGRMFDLSAVTGADNNASFGFRVVATFGPSGSYVAGNSSRSYDTNGTWRFDMVTVSAAPVPEPETYALLLAGLAAIGMLARRRA